MPSTKHQSDTESKPVKKSKGSARPRTRYTQWQREMVALHYPTCRTPEEKLELCRKVGISDIRRLYNLACQMGLTRGSEDLSDAEFREYMAGNKNVMSLRRRHNQQDERQLLERREDPRTTKWSPEDDKFLMANFGRMGISSIALQRGHSETAVMYRSRYLTRQERDLDGNLMPPQPLRRPAIGFSIGRVCAWLGLSEEELRALQTAGVVIRPLPNRRNENQDHWVLARSLAPFLRKYGARLIKEKNADVFFIKEILETEEAITKDKLESESCYFLDHGHKCQNPWSGPCYQLFCDGNDTKCLVKELRW